MEMFLLWTKFVLVISILTCLETVWSEEDCSIEISLPRSPSYDDLTRPNDGAIKRNGQRELRFFNNIINELKQCTESECLVVRGSWYFQQFKICEASSVCYPKKDRTTDKITTETSKIDSVTKTIKSRSCNALAIGMLVLGMGLGSVTMAIVCVFIPSFHRKATKLLNKKAIKKRPSQSTQSARSRQSNSSTQNNQITQQAAAAVLNHQTLQPNEQPTYLELDQPLEPSIYQTLDHVDAQTAHVYTDLAQRRNFYNELGENSAKNRTSVKKDKTDHDQCHSKDSTSVTKNSLPVDSTGYVIMKQTIHSRSENKDIPSEFEDTGDRCEHVNHNYFKLEKHSNQDEVEQTPVYVKLEPENKVDNDGQVNIGLKTKLIP